MKRFIAAMILMAAIAASSQTVAPAPYIDKSGTLFGEQPRSITYSPSDLGQNAVTMPPLLTTPVNSTFTSGAGSCVTGTYFYRVTARDALGATLPSTETSLGVTGPAGVNVNWGTVTGATGGYDIFGRTTGTELFIAHVASGVTTFLDGCTITPSGAMPTANLTGQTVLSTIVNTSAVRALTVTENCTQIANVLATVYAEDAVTALNTYAVVNNMPAATHQTYVATELAPNSTAGTLSIAVRLPQRAIAFSYQNTTANSGTCTARLMLEYD